VELLHEHYHLELVTLGTGFCLSIFIFILFAMDECTLLHF